MSSGDGTAELLARVESARARMAPVRHRVLEAMARRVAQQRGEVRRQLIARVEALMAEPALQAGSAETAPPRPHSAGLSHLIATLNRHAGDAAAAPARLAAPQPLKATVAFQGTWSRLRVEQRLRQALAQVPVQAGPLHSARIVSRALQTLHDLSPAYLDAFIAYVDALQWMEQASGGGSPAPRVSRSRSK